MFLGAVDRPTLTMNSVNLHNNWIELRPDLALAALGGSVPSYALNHGDAFANKTSVY